jgi:hypothetical protein
MTVNGPTRTDPPYVPIRHTAWPTRRSPRLLVLAAVGLVAATVLVGLVHRPSQAQRAADLRAFVSDMTADIQSCAGGVGESEFALGQVQSGATRDVATAVNIAQTGAANCSPANNELLDDLEEYQVTESLASFRLNRVVTGLVTWAAPDAQQVQTDVAHVLTAPDQQARQRDLASLRHDRVTLDAQRAKVDAIIQSVRGSLSAQVAPPRLPS